MFVNPMLLQNGRLTIAPQGRVTWLVRPLLNSGGSPNLANVASGQVPATFQFGPTTGQTLYLAGLSLGFVSSGTTSSTNFGSGAALASGIDLDVCSMGQTNTVYTLKDNMDLVLTFNMGSMIGADKGYLDALDTYLGSVVLSAPIVLENSSGDFIRAVVKNATNSSGSDLRVYLHLYKEI